MEEDNKYISELWAEARKEAPSHSFDEMNAAFLGATASKGILAAKIKSIFTKKIIVMSSIVSIGIGAIITLSPAKQAESPKEHSIKAKPVAEVMSYEQSPEESPEIEASSYVITHEKIMPRETEPDTGKAAPKSMISQPSINIHPGDKQDYIPSYVPSAPKQVMAEEREKLFTVTNSTTRMELDIIKAEAKAAGIELKYTARGNLRKLKIEMVFKDANMQARSSSSFNGTFEHTFGWVCDETGKAIRLYHDEVDESNLFHDPPMITLMPGEEKRVIRIDNETSIEELETYEAYAAGSGVELSYDSKKLINPYFKITLRSDTSLMKSITKRKSGGEEWEIKIGWVADEAGQFVRFLNTEECED